MADLAQAATIPLKKPKPSSAKSAKAKPASPEKKAAPQRVEPFHTETHETPNVYHDHLCEAALDIHDRKEGTDGRRLCAKCAKYGYGQYREWLVADSKDATKKLAANQELLNEALKQKAELMQKPGVSAKALKDANDKIDDLEQKVGRATRRIEREDGFDRDYQAAVQAAVQAATQNKFDEKTQNKLEDHPADVVELLVDIAMNEARDRRIKPLARRCIIYAWINRKGGIAPPIYEEKKDGKKEISEWPDREARFGTNDTDRIFYIDSLRDCLVAVKERFNDADPKTNDPSHGATEWYSPAAIAAKEKKMGHKMSYKDRWWDHKDEFEEVKVSDVPKEQFRFYKKKPKHH